MLIYDFKQFVEVTIKFDWSNLLQTNIIYLSSRITNIKVDLWKNLIFHWIKNILYNSNGILMMSN